MKAFLEITEWDSEFAVPNHVYFLNDSRDKMYGYVRESDGVVQAFAKPYRFHTRGRKFREVENKWNFQVEEIEQKPANRSWQVVGSKGSVYTVTDELGSWSCTCPSAKWQKAECKHIVSIKSKE
jgi:hypothetical protein